MDTKEKKRKRNEVTNKCYLPPEPRPRPGTRFRWSPTPLGIPRPKASEVYCVACGWAGKSASLRLRWKSPTSDPYPVCPTCESSKVHILMRE